MAVKFLIGSGLKPITKGKVKAAGIVRELRNIKMMDSGSLRTVATFAPPMTATVSPASVSGTQGSNGPITVSTGFTTAAPVGGRGPYTYSWTTNGQGFANTPGLARTQFTAEPGPFGTIVSTFTVRITDAVGQIAEASVTARFTNAGGGEFIP